MDTSDDKEKASQDQELGIRQRIAFASGLFQEDVTARTLLETLAEGVVIIDNSGTVLLVNNSAELMFGYQREELIGKHQAVLLPERYRKIHEEHVAQFFAKPGIIMRRRLELAGRRRDGSEFPVEISLNFIETVNGVLALAFVNDITERKQISEALQESEELLRVTFDQAAVGIAHVGPDGRLLRINRKYCDIVGYSEEELKAMTIQEITHPHDRQASMDHFQRMREGQLGSYSLEKRYVHKDGSIIWVNLTVSTVVDTYSKLRFAVGVVVDISARKNAEVEIERLNTDLAARAAELEVANQELEAFNYTVAHDLRKPLTVINGYCQALNEMCGSMLDVSCKGYLREAYEGTWRMNRLIDALLNFSRLAHVETRMKTVDLSSLALEAASELKLAEPGRRVKLVIAERITVYGDAALLRVVLDNLLGNAWKYTGTRDVGIIEFGTMEIDGKQVCFVRDNGAGFDMADEDKLFAPFQRLPGAEECRGSGIGLATVERIIKRHGGKVWAEGEPGKGAVFYFTLSANNVTTICADG